MLSADRVHGGTARDPLVDGAKSTRARISAVRRRTRSSAAMNLGSPFSGASTGIGDVDPGVADTEFDRLFPGVQRGLAIAAHRLRATFSYQGAAR